MNTNKPWRVSESFEYGRHIVDADGAHVSLMEYARLISAAPTMAEFIAKKAASGDAEAVQIMEAINGDS